MLGMKKSCTGKLKFDDRPVQAPSRTPDCMMCGEMCSAPAPVGPSASASTLANAQSKTLWIGEGLLADLADAGEPGEPLGPLEKTKTKTCYLI